MANTSAQLAQIIKKLLEKTSAGELKWSPSLMSGKFQVRFGDYAIEISGRPGLQTGSIAGGASIQVTKLDGTSVASAGGYSGVASVLYRNDLDFAAQANLNELYSLVADRSNDLDELLKLI